MIIGFAGRKRSGKDTAAAALIAQGFYPTSFAKKLKLTVDRYLGVVITPEEDREKDQEFFVYDKNLIKAGRWLGWDTATVAAFFIRFQHVMAPYQVHRCDTGVRYETSARKVMQLFGTDVCRYIQNDIWTNALEDDIEGKLNVVVTDIRFNNEATIISMNGGKVIEIIGKSCYNDTHDSERGVDPELIDKQIYNTGTKQELQDKVLHYWRTHDSKSTQGK